MLHYNLRIIWTNYMKEYQPIRKKYLVLYKFRVLSIVQRDLIATKMGASAFWEGATLSVPHHHLLGIVSLPTHPSSTPYVQLSLHIFTGVFYTPLSTRNSIRNLELFRSFGNSETGEKNVTKVQKRKLQYKTIYPIIFNYSNSHKLNIVSF